MFKNIRNRMWLLGIAKHELYKSLMPTDTATLKSTMTAFEKDMRKEKSWPFDDPETLSLFFSAWMGKHLAPHKFDLGKPPTTPWTPQQWQIITEIVPDLIRVRFETIGKQLQEALSNDWSLGYAWGYFSGWIKEMPRQTMCFRAHRLHVIPIT